jgi:hypothetical protein
MKTSIIIRKTFGGFKVLRNNTGGVNKGETTLGSFCGGAIGRILTIQCAKTASLLTMADEVAFEYEDGVINGEQEIIDALAAFEEKV